MEVQALCHDAQITQNRKRALGVDSGIDADSSSDRKKLKKEPEAGARGCGADPSQ
jgi:hypothetical protein